MLSENFAGVLNERYIIHHIQHISSRSYEQVVADFERLVPPIAPNAIIEVVKTTKDQADFEQRIHELEGKSGLMAIVKLDHSAWLPRMNINGKKLRMYLIGNPLVAAVLFNIDLRIAEYAPVRLLIYENTTDGTVRLTYDLPSSVFANWKDENITAIAKKLEAKIQDVCQQVAGTFVRPS